MYQLVSQMILIDIDEVPFHSSLSKAEQAQLPQPFLVGEMFQSLHHVHSPPVDLLQDLHVSVVLRSPELDTALQLPPGAWRKEGFFEKQKTLKETNGIEFLSPLGRVSWRYMKSLKGHCCKIGLSGRYAFACDMNSGIECTLRKFANDTKLCGAVYMLEGRDAIQRDLDRLERWAYVILMKFNKTKCKVWRGHGNPKQKYRLEGEWIENSPEEKDLGVLVNKKLNMTCQCVLTA
ncbi:hypothetical protein BTVI_42146 [Pitangus sulphuratus]|nr:hypothetical protein BTVI_42146 [Pitangus sulphuratus]